MLVTHPTIPMLLAEISSSPSLDQVGGGGRKLLQPDSFHATPDPGVRPRSARTALIRSEPPAPAQPMPLRDETTAGKSSVTMEDNQLLEECRTHVEPKSTETDVDAGSGEYGIVEDFHDDEKDMLSSEVLLSPRENEMPTAKPNHGRKGHACGVCRKLSVTMEDHQLLEECRTQVEPKSTETDVDAGSGEYGIVEDFHDDEKDLLSSEVLLPPRAKEMPTA
ncbi:unnamed protein product, partial [Cyprideis torosa]